MRRKKPIKKKLPKWKPFRLARSLNEGERLVVLGVRGKPVKRLRPGRKHVLQIRRGNRVLGYVNNVKQGKPVAAAFTASMISRLIHSKRKNLQSALKNSKVAYSFKLTNKKYIKKQIPKKVIRLIEDHAGDAFGFTVRIGRTDKYLTPMVFTDGKMSNDDLTNLITSNFLMTLRRNLYSMSAKVTDMTQNQKIRCLDEADIDLIFSNVEVGEKKRKNKRSKNVTRNGQTKKASRRAGKYSARAKRKAKKRK